MGDICAVEGFALLYLPTLEVNSGTAGSWMSPFKVTSSQTITRVMPRSLEKLRTQVPGLSHPYSTVCVSARWSVTLASQYLHDSPFAQRVVW